MQRGLLAPEAFLCSALITLPTSLCSLQRGRRHAEPGRGAAAARPAAAAAALWAGAAALQPGLLLKGPAFSFWPAPASTCCLLRPLAALLLAACCPAASFFCFCPPSFCWQRVITCVCVCVCGRHHMKERAEGVRRRAAWLARRRTTAVAPSGSGAGETVMNLACSFGGIQGLLTTHPHRRPWRSQVRDAIGCTSPHLQPRGVRCAATRPPAWRRHGFAPRFPVCRLASHVE